MKKEENKETKVQEKRTTKSKVINTIGLILCIILLPVVIISGTLFVQHLLDDEVPPSFLGYTPLIVDTGSMAPVYEAGDLAVIRNMELEEAAALEEGPVICYKTGEVYVTHRIVGIEYTDSGEKMFVTKGDANNIPDTVRVAPSQVLGVYLYHIDNLGSFALFMQTPLGMILVVILPLLILFLAFYMIDKKKMRDLMKESQKVEQPAPETEKNN